MTYKNQSERLGLANEPEMDGARHGGMAGLCEQDHICPSCEDTTDVCMDLFVHPTCGLVACSGVTTGGERR